MMSGDGWLWLSVAVMIAILVVGAVTLAAR